MNIALVALNPIVGDFQGNLNKIFHFLEQAREKKADLIVFPELALVGYTPQDLLLRPSFVDLAEKQLEELRRFLSEREGFKKIGVIVGTVLASPEKNREPLVNCAAFIHGGKVVYRAKTLIPYYDIFNERRYFASAQDLPPCFRGPVDFLGQKIGILVCEDSWQGEKKYGRSLYQGSPAKDLGDCAFAVNISASPFSAGMRDKRRLVLSKIARAHNLPIFYVSQFGGQDELVFDGDQFAVDETGRLVGEAEGFSEQCWLVDRRKPREGKPLEKMEQVHRALCVGISDYVRKNGFQKVVLGLSGGLDSAVVAVLAVDALGKENVMAVTLPGKASSSHSVTDGKALSANLGIRLEYLPIKFLQSTLAMALEPYFKGRPEDSTEENLQARTRGLLLMALANKFNYLLLATGNKSEFAVGYATLYGDMCGALAPIGDLYKTQVYELARYMNRQGERIPVHILEKPPSAELRPHQTDQDTLPPYGVLDPVLHCLVEQEKTAKECLEELCSRVMAVDASLVADIERRLWSAEYKRKQFSPILRISDKAFGVGRRYPITSRILV